MQQNLRLEVVPADELSPDLVEGLFALCNRAFQEDVKAMFAGYTGATHVIGFLGSTLVSHALWVPRWLQPGAGPFLRTAYIEMVATEPQLHRNGFATAVMRRVASEIIEYDLGALGPAVPEFYVRLGWVFWRGPLFIRSGQGLIPTPDERVMNLRLPKTPVLDLDQPLSAEWRAGELW